MLVYKIEKLRKSLQYDDITECIFI